MANLRILVADDSQFMRTAYKRILETQDNFEVIAVASDGEEALEKALALNPNVAVLDVRMPKMDGIEAAHRMITNNPNIAIVIISAYDDITFVSELFRDGPQRKAYLLKNSLDDIGELIRVVEAVINGQTVLDPGIVQKLARLYVRQSRSVLAQLDATERNVLEVMAEGYADDYIAQTLHLDRQKVEECAASIYQKLGLSEQEGSTMRNQAVEAFINQITATPYVLEREGNG